MKYHIIANPAAGKHKSLKRLEIVKNIFKKKGVEFETHLSQGEHDATSITNRLTLAGENEIIALGGDGTLHEVLNGIADPTVCNLGCIPAGTGNDFAERAHLPLDVEKATELILDTQAKPTDYLSVGGVRCMNVAGLGMDVDVLERCKKGKLKGKLKYVMSLLQSLFAFKGYKIQLQAEGVQEERDVLIAAACNGGLFGGGIQICPAAEIDDGLLDMMVVDCIGGKFKIIKAFFVLMKGGIMDYPLAKHIRCEKAKITPALPCTVQLDGELYKNIEFEVEVKKGLKFYRP